LIEIVLLAAGSLIAAQPACWVVGADLRRSGENGEAERILEACLRDRPNDADALVQLGFARLAQSDWDGAEDAFDDALALAPDYEDASLGLARIAYFRGNFDSATERLAGLDPTRADVADLHAAVERARDSANARSQYPWRVDVSYSQSSLTADLPDWSQISVALGRQLSDHSTLTALVSSAERFNQRDTLAQLRLDRRLGNDRLAHFAIAGAPDSVFSPEIRLLAGIDARVAAQTRASLGLSLARYASGNVATFTPSLSHTVADGRARLTARAILLRDEAGVFRSGWSVGADWQTAPRIGLFTSYTDAPETSEGVTLDVRAAVAGLSYQVNDRTRLTVTCVHEMRSAYDRTGLSLGLSRRF
jgi:YaiO family outer membrane protein